MLSLHLLRLNFDSPMQTVRTGHSALASTLVIILCTCAGRAQVQPTSTNAAPRANLLAAAAQALPAPGTFTDAGDFYYVEGMQKVSLLRAEDEVGVSQPRALTFQQAFGQLHGIAGVSSLRAIASLDRGAGGGRFTIVTASGSGQPKLDSRAIAASADVAYAYAVLVDPQSRLRAVPTDEAIVRLRPGVTAVQLEDEIIAIGYRTVESLGPPNLNTYLLRLLNPKTHDPLEASRKLALHSSVLWASPNFVKEIQFCYTPNDPLFAKQQYLSNTGQNGAKPGADIGATNAWDITRGTNTVVIAILDTGVDTSHPDLRIWNNSGETGLDAQGRDKASNGVDDDGNGYVDDYRGWDFSTAGLLSMGDNNPNPSLFGNGYENGHGTACAGMAAAIGDNGKYISGIAPDCSILPVKIATDDGTFADGNHLLDDVRLGNAIYYAASNNAAVISCSFKVFYSDYANDAISYAVQSGRSGKGSLVFCSTGNDASLWKSHDRFPIGVLPPGDLYRIHFVYTNVTANGVVQIDNVYLLGADQYTHLTNVLPDEDFESGFTANGWVVNNTLGLPSFNWFASSDVPFKGTGGSLSASGGTFNNPFGFHFESRLVSPPLALSGNETLAFTSYYALPPGAYFRIELWSVLGNVKLRDLLPFPFPGGTSNFPPVDTRIGWPAGHPDTIAVGASTDRDFRADYSQYGDSTYGGTLDFLAPSDRGWNAVVTLDPTGFIGETPSLVYSNFSGTSAACPLAAGVGALVLTVNPELRATEVRTLMQQTCDKIGGVTYTNGRHFQYGYGRVNASNAVRRAMVNLAVTQAVQGTISLGNPFSYLITVTNAGPSREGAVVVSNQLPAGVTFNSAILSQGTNVVLSGNLVVCNLGSLSPGTNATIQLNVTSPTAGTLVNQVRVTGNAMDVTLANNTSAITNTVASSTVALRVDSAGVPNVIVGATVGGNNFAFATPFTNQYALSESVTLDAITGITRGRFVKWQKDGVDLTTNNEVNLIMDTNHTMIAVYDPSPFIMNQPQNQTKSAGQSATFSAFAGGLPSLNYQWRKDDTDLAGATAASYSIPNVKSAHSGNYRVFVTNAYGVTNSTAAQLTVLPATNLSRAAIFGAPSTDSWNDDVRAKLLGTGLFQAIDLFRIKSGDPTPTLVQLQQYDAVLVYSDAGFNDSVALGNVLADYLDNGGGVVLATFAYNNAGAQGIAGRIRTAGYLPFTTGFVSEANGLTLVKGQPSHPILSGVFSFQGGTSSHHIAGISATSNAVLVAHWSNGQPLVAAKQLPLGQIVGLNFYPPSSDARADFWTANTDGARLIANALLWAASRTTATVYDNTQSSLGFYRPTTNEYGDEIVLAPGPLRTVTQFFLSYFAALTSTNGKTAVVRFYRNDGLNPAGSPGTTIFESQPLPLASGNTFLSLTDRVAVPGRFTWTVQFMGLAANENAGLLAYSPPIVGSNFVGWWERVGGVWNSNTFFNGTPGSWAAQIIAAPTTPPRLTGVLASNQTFQIRLFGDPGLRTTVLTSTNLSDWSMLQVVTNPVNPPLLIDVPFGGAPWRFFRAMTP